ncbi:MAG: PTS sugar transporter subunit IIA, partial [Planctomycetota bacterium]
SWISDEEEAIRQARREQSGRADASALLLSALNEKTVLMDLTEGSKPELLQRLVDHALAKAGQHFDREQALQLLVEREHFAPTGLGNGIAIPHCRLLGLDRPVLVLARHRDGLVFGGVDDNPCTLILMILSSARDPGMHLKLLAATAHILGNQDIRLKIQQSQTSEEIVGILRDIAG